MSEHKNQKEYTNALQGALYNKALTYGERGMWWALLIPADGSSSRPVSFDTRAPAEAYVKRQFKKKPL